MANEPLTYPVHLGLAYLFLVGYLVRTVFVNLRLPGAVGVILTGLAFSYFIQEDIFFGRDHLQGLAFFLVLLTAGFEISLADLKPYIWLYAILPAFLELSGIAAYAFFVLKYSKVEACVLGTVLFAIGDGLVIPKMGEFGVQFPGHQLPRLVFTWAPLEASFALTLFGVLQGLAEPLKAKPAGLTLLILGNVLRIVATVAFGALVGCVSGWLIPRRTQAVVRGKQLFTGATVEAYLMILAVALAGFGLGAAEGGVTMVPMGFSPGSMFQPELLVIIIGCCFAAVADPDVLHNVETTMAGVWVFGQLILFSMLGSKTDPGVFTHFFEVLPMIGVGLTLRFIGILVVTYSTLRCRQCNCDTCYKANLASAMPDTVFCFLSTLPRASIQGALGTVPLTQKFFQFDPNRAHVQTFIATAARLYIVVMAIVGSILLDALGPAMLKASEEREERCQQAVAKEEEYAELGWTDKDRRRSMRYAPLEMEEEVTPRGPTSVCLACCRRPSSNLAQAGAMGILNFIAGREKTEEDWSGLPMAPSARHAVAALAQEYNLNEVEVVNVLKNAAAGHTTDEDGPRVKPSVRISALAPTARFSVGRPMGRMATMGRTRSEKGHGVRRMTVNLFESAMPVVQEVEDAE